MLAHLPYVTRSPPWLARRIMAEHPDDFGGELPGVICCSVAICHLLGVKVLQGPAKGEDCSDSLAPPERGGFKVSVPIAGTRDRKSDAFLRDGFDSQFDSHGLGQGRMKGTRAEIKPRSFA